MDTEGSPAPRVHRGGVDTMTAAAELAHVLWATVNLALWSAASWVSLHAGSIATRAGRRVTAALAAREEREMFP
jgi:hypothetical protein